MCTFLSRGWQLTYYFHLSAAGDYLPFIYIGAGAIGSVVLLTCCMTLCYCCCCYRKRRRMK